MSETGTSPLPTTTTTAPVIPPQPLNTTDVINTYARVVVSIIVLLAFMFAVVMSWTKTLPDTPTTTQVINLLGTLSTLVVSFWVGSSSGSVSKSATIKDQSAMLASAPPPVLPSGSTIVTSTPAKTTTTTDEGTKTTTGPSVVVTPGTAP